ncbi:MAG: hypothetical protein V4662_23670 [Verrucomicrobiota bacterium]
MKLATEGGFFFQATVWKASEGGAAVEVWHKSRRIGHQSCQFYRLSDDEWTKLEAAFRKLRFSRMPEHARPYALDGNAWWLEARQQGQSHCVVRINPESAEEERDFMELALLFSRWWN